MHPSVDPLDAPAHLQARLTTWQAFSARLAGADDRQLSSLFEASAKRASFGGRSALLEIDGAKVWGKGIALTDLERLPHNRHCTANLFKLPLFYQYGVGSAGFGAWRELAANLAATAWVVGDECASFPLLYHWRVLPAPRRPPPGADELARTERYITGWNGSPAVRARWQANFEATANLVLFLEYVPQTAYAWVTAQAGEGAEAAAAAFAMLDDELTAAARFLNARGMQHFDLHSENVLTDGRQLYIADFGLANSSAFELSAAERAFFDRHQDYDRAYVAGALARLYEAVRPPTSASLDARIERHRPLASIQNEFLRALREDNSKQTPFPAEAV